MYYITLNIIPVPEKGFFVCLLDFLNVQIWKYF